MIRAVVFDYGGVLSRDQDKETFSVMAEIAGVSPEDLAKVYWPGRVAYDLGSLTGVRYWESSMKKLGITLEKEQIDILIRLDSLSWSQLSPFMLRWAHAVSLSGRITAICSNIPPEMVRVLFDNMLCSPDSGLPHPLRFDPVITSCSIGINKPDPGIYKHLLDKLSLKPHEVLFIDDREDNAEGARALGISAVVYKSFNSLMQQVKAIDPSLPVF